MIILEMTFGVYGASEQAGMYCYLSRSISCVHLAHASPDRIELRRWIIEGVSIIAEKFPNGLVVKGITKYGHNHAVRRCDETCKSLISVGVSLARRKH